MATMIQYVTDLGDKVYERLSKLLQEIVKY